MLIKEKLANGKAIDSTDDLARRKIRGLSWNSALWQKKKTEMPHVGYEQLLGFGNLYISLKTYQKKKLLKRALWYKFLTSCENGFLFTC